jgi:elongation factor P
LKKPEGEMINASQLRSGMAIRYEGQTYKVIAAEYHPGQGRMGGQAHARLQNLTTATFWEHSFRSEMKLDEVSLARRPMEFLYTNAGQCCFMDPESYEQIEILNEVVGERAIFLEPGMKLGVEFLEDRPVSVGFPDVLEVKIADTAPPMHQQADSAFKTARLANGVEVMVPQFVKNGDVIRLDLTTRKYMDRAKVEAKVKGA